MFPSVLAWFLGSAFNWLRWVVHSCGLFPFLLFLATILWQWWDVIARRRSSRVNDTSRPGSMYSTGDVDAPRTSGNITEDLDRDSSDAALRQEVTSPRALGTSAMRTLDHGAYTVGWICAIGTECVAARAFLDEMHNVPGDISNDDNYYIFGNMGKHNIVIAVLPTYGTAAATCAAKDLSRTFPNIRFALMVGIGGGAPCQKNDIRLGDVVVSKPRNGNGGVLQYDFGKSLQGSPFRPTGHQNEPPALLLAVVEGVEAQYKHDGHHLREAIDGVLKKNPRLRREYKRPDPDTDRLYRSDFAHVNEDLGCTECCGKDASRIVSRHKRTKGEDNPTIHHGLIASANMVMKDAFIRDKLINRNNVLCFEMEAAGLMNVLPSLVIRGICDYSDSHKNKKWQGYAAMTAAAYAKDILHQLPPTSVMESPRIGEILSGNTPKSYDHATQEIFTKYTGLQNTAREHLAMTEEIARTQRDFTRQILSEKEEQCHQLFHLTSENGDSTYTWYKDYVKNRVEGTCRWFLEHGKFQEWLRRGSGPLLVSADPGCGKSVLAKYLVDHILPMYSPVCYFFFKDQDQDNVRQALCALLHQLFDMKPFLIGHAMAQFRKDGQGMINSTHSLWTIINNTLRDAKIGAITFVLDAIDECAEAELENLVGNLAKHVCANVSSHSQIKILMTSRPYEQIISKFELQLTDFSSIHIPGQEDSDTISQEVSLVIRDQVDQLGQDLSDDVKCRLVERMLEVPHRTYLWVHLVFENLKAEGFKKTTKGVDLALSTLPTTINDAYERILKRSTDPASAKKALSVMLAASRPLSSSEMNVAMNIDNKLNSVHDLDLESRKDFEHSLRRWCGLFVLVHQDKIYFLHQTVREFLLADIVSHPAVPSELRWHHSFTTKGTQLALATLCVHYLDILNCGFKPPKDTDEDKKQLKERLAFLEYAAKNWCLHFRDAEVMQNHAIVPLSLMICDPGSKIYAVWFKMCWGHLKMAPEGWTRLMISSFFGLYAIVKLVLMKDCNLEAKDSKYSRTPLSWASCEGQMPVAKLLLESGADIDALDGRNRTPLSLAAENGHGAVVKMLLENGQADINAASRGGHDSGRSPLSFAAENGHEQVVDMLLAHRGVILDLEDSSGITPLMYAVASANSNIAMALISHGASASRVDYERKGLLHHALTNSNTELHLVKALIVHGASTKAQDAENMMPLHYTVRFCRTDVAELLLQTEVCVDILVHRRTWRRHYSSDRRRCEPDPLQHASINTGLTPLHYAAWVGSDEMVAYFLKKGANPNALSDHGETPLQLAVANKIGGNDCTDYWKAEHWKIEVTLDFIGLGSDGSDAEYDATYRNIVAQRLRVINALLNDTKTDPNIKDCGGETALHTIQYGKYGSSQYVDALLQSGAVPTGRHRDKNTPLHLACARGDFESVSILASSQQLPLSNVDEENALHLACKSGCYNTLRRIIDAAMRHEIRLSSTKNRSQRNALHLYLQNIVADLEGVEILLDYGVDASEIDCDGNYPLSTYIKRKLGDVDLRICQLLFTDRVNSKHLDKQGATFAHLYASSSKVTVLVLKFLGDAGVPLSATDRLGRNLLHLLVINGSLTDDILDFLCSTTSISVDSPDASGKTPMQYAEEGLVPQPS